MSDQGKGGEPSSRFRYIYCFVFNVLVSLRRSLLRKRPLHKLCTGCRLEKTLSKEKSITLVWYCKTERGWRQFPAIITTEHGRKIAKHCHVIDRGEEACYPEGRFQLRTFDGPKTVYRNVPESAQHPRDAVLFLEREQRLARANQNPEFKSGAGLIKNAAHAYVKHLEDSNKMEAAEITRVALDDFMKHCPTQYVKALPSSPSCVTAFHKALREKGLSLRTIHNKHNRVKAFLKWSKVETKWMSNPEPYELPLPTIYNPPEIKAIRQAVATDDTLSLAIDMGLMLGLREREIIFAQWSDIDWTARVFRVQGKPHLGFKVKDSEQREVPIPPELFQRLMDRHANHEAGNALILHTRNGKPLTPSKLLHKLKHTAMKAGLQCGTCKGCRNREQGSAHAGCEKWQMHKWRRTYLTTILRNGVDLRTAQSFAGHSDLDSTLRYLRPAASNEVQDKVGAIKWGA